MRDILGSFRAILMELDPSGGAVEPLVFAAWRRCVDGVMAENVVPFRLEKDRLTAAVPNETWRRNVAELGPALAAKVNAAIGSSLVKFIEFQVNPAAVREHRRSSEKTGATGFAPSDVIAEDIRSAADAINDEELREQFLAAAASSLARPENTER